MLGSYKVGRMRCRNIFELKTERVLVVLYPLNLYPCLYIYACMSNIFLYFANEYKYTTQRRIFRDLVIIIYSIFEFLRYKFAI